MSLILEALRRSEAERRLGHAPDLLSPMAMAARRRRRPWLRAFAIALALLIVGAAAWWLGQRSAAPPVPAEASGTGAAREAAPTTAPDASAPAVPPTGPTAPPAMPAAARTAPPVSTATSTATPTPAPAAPAATPPPTVRPPAEPAPTAAQSPDGPASAEDLAELRARLAPAAAAAPVVPPATATSTPADASLPPLSSLPVDLRSGLPPLRLTMHVYNESPERRFVILDGRRLGEGMTITGNLAIAEIRRDGVVLDLDGRRVLLPRP